MELSCRMLEARNLECIRGDHRLFSDLSFTLDAGELLHVCGSNGSGKTSLLRIVCGLYIPDNGEVNWRRKNIRKLREEYFRELTYVGHLNGIKDDLSGLENLRIGCKLAQTEASEHDIKEALLRMGLERREDLPAKFLSQGQKRRVALARLFLSKAVLWVLDEPFTALDTKAIELLRLLIGKHLQGGGIVILTSHQTVAIDAGSLNQINLDS